MARPDSQPHMQQIQVILDRPGARDIVYANNSTWIHEKPCALWGDDIARASHGSRKLCTGRLPHTISRVLRYQLPRAK